MSLNLMYITNNPQVALIAEAAGVDRIFVDMEYIGKSDRQGGMDTVQCRHTYDDIKAISKVLSKAELLVRINPIHECSEKYTSSKEEIDRAIENGAKILMLPYFKSKGEVESFVEYVNRRAKVMPLVETPEAVGIIDEILKIKGIDEIYIGLNDLSLGLEKKFMFELLADGTVDKLAEKIKDKNIPFGFGGLASLNGGLLPGHMVLKEHYRLGSDSVILSRSFCDINKHTDIEEIKAIFHNGVKEIRICENQIKDSCDFVANRLKVRDCVKRIVGEKS